MSEDKRQEIKQSLAGLQWKLTWYNQMEARFDAYSDDKTLDSIRDTLGTKKEQDTGTNSGVWRTKRPGDEKMIVVRGLKNIAKVWKFAKETEQQFNLDIGLRL